MPSRAREAPRAFSFWASASAEALAAEAARSFSEARSCGAAGPWGVSRSREGEGDARDATSGEVC